MAQLRLTPFDTSGAVADKQWLYRNCPNTYDMWYVYNPWYTVRTGVLEEGLAGDMFTSASWRQADDREMYGGAVSAVIVNSDGKIWGTLCHGGYPNG